MKRPALRQFIVVRSAQVSCFSVIAVQLLSSTAMAVPAVEGAAVGTISRPDGDGSDGAKAVKAFLAKTYPKQGWVNGPSPVESDTIRKAYPNRKFYFVFSPSYPVARDGQISTIVGLDKDGTPELVSGPADFSKGLAKIKTEEDAKISAAAILSLVMTWRGPLAVTAEELTAKKTADGGWQCTATRGVPKPAVGADGVGVAKFGGIYLYADFSAEGKCTRVEIEDRSPRPICIGGLFWSVKVPQHVSTELGYTCGDGLLTASVEPDSIAAKAGLQAGDMIVAFDDKALPPEDTVQQMRQVVYPLKQSGNAERSITVLRDGRLVRLTLHW